MKEGLGCCEFIEGKKNKWVISRLWYLKTFFIKLKDHSYRLAFDEKRLHESIPEMSKSMIYKNVKTKLSSKKLRALGTQNGTGRAQEKTGKFHTHISQTLCTGKCS